MAYQFPPDLDERVKQQMATGGYASEDDVLRAALRALDAHKTDYAAIQAGVEDMQSGRTRPLTEVADEIRQEHSWTTDA